jgi:hypothetical protein
MPKWSKIFVRNVVCSKIWLFCILLNVRQHNNAKFWDSNKWWSKIWHSKIWNSNLKRSALHPMQPTSPQEANYILPTSSLVVKGNLTSECSVEGTNLAQQVTRRYILRSFGYFFPVLVCYTIRKSGNPDVHNNRFYFSESSYLQHPIFNTHHSETEIVSSRQGD